MSLDEAFSFIVTYYRVYLECGYSSLSVDYFLQYLRPFFPYYSHVRTAPSFLPQNSYYVERNYDWSQQLMREPQTPPTPLLDIICHNPQLAPVVNMDGQKAVSNSPCHCVHCFIHDAYFLLSVHRCIYIFSPSSASTLSPFNLSSSEFQALQDGTLRLRLFNVLYEDGKWRFSANRYRFHLNSIDVFALHVRRAAFLRSRISPSRTATISARSSTQEPTT